ncbi:transposase [Streptomyces sp. TG1A-8]|uniref:transposase n=1 Tax=Streptomyces sp. TG1A-8 TaxID=3051385 RepID=UPI00265BB180|nr:transposase [Streptomyces sp. TG1A-8]MDO0930064.1 transposase [Streptomyces sp. TG1A-8]
MGRGSPYPEEFRNDAVALYRAAAGRRTYAAVAADVGVTGETLRSWVRQADEQAGRVRGGEAMPEERDEELARLRAELGRLRKAEAEWQLEREILRRAAQYFARKMKA